MNIQIISHARTRLASLLVLGIFVTLAGCASVIPSTSTGTSKAWFTKPSEIPMRFTINAKRGLVNDAVADALISRLPAIGFTFVQEDASPDSILFVKARYSDFAPVHLELTLSNAKTGQVLWEVNVSREWDIYASVISASESNVEKAIELLRKDIASAE